MKMSTVNNMQLCTELESEIIHRKIINKSSHSASIVKSSSSGGARWRKHFRLEGRATASGGAATCNSGSANRSSTSARSRISPTPMPAKRDELGALFPAAFSAEKSSSSFSSSLRSSRRRRRRLKSSRREGTFLRSARSNLLMRCSASRVRYSSRNFRERLTTRTERSLTPARRSSE